MMQAQFNLKLLQRLLFTGEVINIRVRDIIGFAKEAVRITVDDLIRQIEKLLIRIAHKSSIKNMIIVSAAVKTDQTETHQFFNLSRSRVNHTNNRLSFAFNLPVYKEEVREHLNIIEHKLGIIIVYTSRLFGRFELHFIDQLDTVISLMCAACCKCQYCITHVSHIVFEVARISFLKNFVNEVDTWLSSRMVLLIQISFNLGSKTFLALHSFEIYHLFFSFQW